MTELFREGDTVYFYDHYYRGVSCGKCHSVVYDLDEQPIGYILSDLRVKRLYGNRPSKARYINAHKAFSTSEEVKRHRMLLTLRGEWY